MPITVHPDYTATLPELEFYAAADQGGSAYIEGKTPLGNEMLARFSGDFETKPAYDRRKNLAQPPEISNRIVSMTDRFVQTGQWGLASDDKDATPKLDEWQQTAGRNGCDLLKCMHDAGRGAQVFGTWWLGLDSGTADESVDFARLTPTDVSNLGLRPFLTQNDPRSIVDWAYDEAGNLTRLVVKEVEKTKASIVDPIKTTVYYREWYSDGWKRYNDNGGKTDEGTHQFRVVPFFPMHFLDPEQSAARSQLRGIAGPERLLFNIDSWSDAELSRAAYTWFALLTRELSTSQPKEIKVATGGIVRLEGTQIERMGCDPAVITALSTRREQCTRQILDNAYLTHEASSVSAVASGERLRVERLTYDDVLVFTAKERARTINEILVVLAALGVVEPGSRVTPPKSFDARAREMALTELERIAELKLIPPHAKRLKTQAWVEKELPDLGDDDRARLKTEFEDDGLFEVTNLFGGP